jgi:hypothetical protein
MRSLSSIHNPEAGRNYSLALQIVAVGLAFLMYATIFLPSSHSFMRGQGKSHYNPVNHNIAQFISGSTAETMLNQVNGCIQSLAKATANAWPICTYPKELLFIQSVFTYTAYIVDADIGKKKIDLIYPFHYFW